MKKIFKRGMSGLLAVLLAFTVLAGFGTTTAFAASETAESYMISFPRDGDAAQIYSEDAWGHSAKSYMNGWATGSSNYTTLHCMDSFDGKVCYCIEPGLSRNVGDTYHGFGEDFWDNYPSQYNNTIEPDDIKLLLGRIMQYGYQGNLSTSWRSQNDSDADKLAHAFATQLLVWETVVGERDVDFDHVSTGGYDEILSLVSPNHPLYSRIMDYYDSIEYSVQSHAVCPSFMSRSSGGAKTIELAWDGSQYIAELTDTNRVLSQFTFSASETGFHFSVSGNTLTITTDTAPSGNVTISATRSASRCGVLVWTDYKYGPNGGVQDTITYTASVSDPVRAFLKLKVSYGGAKIIKTSEDSKVDGITFTITGEGVNQSVTTDRNGEIHIDNLMPGIYTVTEQSYDKYVPQESHRVTVLAGQRATVSFNNVLRRGEFTVTKTSEDGLNQGVKFHLFGTSLSGLPVDEFAVTDETVWRLSRMCLSASATHWRRWTPPFAMWFPTARVPQWNGTAQPIRAFPTSSRNSMSPSPRATVRAEWRRATLRFPVLPTASIRAISLWIPTTPMKLVSSPPAIMSAATTGRFVRSAPPRNICWTAPFILSAQRQSITPLS